MTVIASWNVNGVRAAVRNGMLDWLRTYKPDILCIQETKAQVDQLAEEILAPGGSYASLWQSAEKRGYSGVATYMKKTPLSVSTLDVERFDSEGRVQILEFEQFTVVNTYFPNSREGGARLSYKIDFCDTLLARLNVLRSEGKKLILCGDYNIAHTPIDLANPKQNEKNAGYLPEERAWMSAFLEAGFIDTFRMFTTEGGHYTWRTYRFNARKKNVGWRIDYHCVNQELGPQVKSSIILDEVMGSDHCPVVLELEE